MDILLIVVKHPEDEIPWIANAWDEWCVDANYQGWEEAVEKVKTENPKGDVRVAKVSVSPNFLFKIFEPIEEKANAEETHLQEG